MTTTFAPSTCAGVIALLICAAGGLAHAQAPSPPNTIRLDVGQERSVNGRLKALQKRRYKLVIEKPGGVLVLDHIKRNIGVTGRLYDSKGSPRDFDFREHFERGIEPGNYVLELVGASDGAHNNEQGFFSLRLSLRADLSRDTPGIDTIRLRMGQDAFLQGSLPQQRHYKIVVEGPGGILLLDEGKLDFVAPRFNLYDSNGVLLPSDRTEAFFEREVDPGSYMLELIDGERGTSPKHYMFRLSLRPRP